MKVSEKMEPGVPFVLVLTYDGRLERGLLEGVAGRFDERILLWFPPPRGKRGLRTVCEDLKLHLERAYRYKCWSPSVLVLMMGDKEHFEEFLAGRATMADELRGVMTNYGIDILKIEQLPVRVEEGSSLCDLLVVKGSHGSRPFTALVVALGERKCVEENIALISSHLGLKEIPSTTREIRRLLSDRERVSDTLLERALPCLCAALRQLRRLLSGMDENEVGNYQGPSYEDIKAALPPCG